MALFNVTAEPRYNEGVYGLAKCVRYDENSLYRGSFFIYFTITGVKKSFRLTEDFVIYRFVISRRHRVIQYTLYLYKWYS